MHPRSIVAIAVLVATLAAACTAGGPSDGAGSAGPDASGPLGGGSPSPSPEPGEVRLALDWTPNTNHTAFYVARANGWYEEAAVDLEILPYSGTAPETLMAAGQAECGISFQDSMTFAVAAGAPLQSVMAILQHTASEIAVLESSDFARPRDLDGATYAGFAYPNEVPTVRAVIVADGGQGIFSVATLDSLAYEALYDGRADFTIVFTAWEGVEASLRDIPLRTFRFADYGFPDFYQVVLACETGWLDEQPALARRFVEATLRGLETAAVDPEGAAALLVQENPGVFESNPELPVESALLLARGDYLVDDEGRVGTQALERWRGYSGFLYYEGLLTGPDGAPLGAPPDYETLFTNAYLPEP
jgi:ABC-type nitrate/sulfonate/bicarbonate transport system substrate-binding protein